MSQDSPPLTNTTPPILPPAPDIQEPHTHPARNPKLIPLTVAGIVAAIFILMLFSFQLDATQSAVVIRFGRLTEVVSVPGFHFRWPKPVDEVFFYDHQLHSFVGKTAELEEVLTKDKINLIVGVHLVWKISDPARFYRELKSVAVAETRIDPILRQAKLSAIGTYESAQLLNPDPKQIRLAEIGNLIKNQVDDSISKFGVTIVSAGIRMLKVPDAITTTIQDRMIAERKVAAKIFSEKGRLDAERIKVEAEREKSQIIAEAEAQAKGIRATGDAAAASSYQVFAQNPELADLLRKTESISRLLNKRSTLILDTETAPFDILKNQTLPVKP